MQREKERNKTLKTITLVIALVLIIVITHSCWKDDANHHYRIPFKNATDYSIYIRAESKEQYMMSPHFQDTILHPWYVDPSHDTINTKIRPKEEFEEAFFDMTCYEADFGYSYDTLLIFVFNADTLDTYGWDYVREHYKVLQRYDLSLEDLQDLNFRLCFPPSEAMKHIHMWPPYGTYDENGNRITIK